VKAAVVNFSGNVGKSVTARHLLAPRIDEAQVIPVESINSDGTQDETLRGKQFAELGEVLAILDNAVVDVGSSNIEDFVVQMRKYSGSHEDFDFFVVPTVPAQKQQRDTISTIDALSALGIPATKIRVLFNQVEADQQIERVFAGLFEYHAAEKNFTLHADAIIHVNEIFPRLNGSNQTIAGILSDKTDLKKLLNAAKDAEDKLNISRRIAIRRLAVGVAQELDAAFAALMR
jgi:hypothetical protein